MSDNFEQAIKKLESIVETLDRGELTLEETLKSFEEGMNLVRDLLKKLEEADKKIELLSRAEGGSVVLKPFDGIKDEKENL